MTYKRLSRDILSKKWGVKERGKEILNVKKKVLNIVDIFSGVLLKVDGILCDLCRIYKKGLLWRFKFNSKGQKLPSGDCTYLF